MTNRTTTDQDLRAEIERFVREHPENRFPDTGAPYFDAPIVGVARADDPLFEAYKDIIGTFHHTPREILSGAASVVCWVLPITRPTREANRREKEMPSYDWAACIDRCPPGAITKNGHDKALCNAYLEGKIKPAVAEKWGTPIPGCGLCQTRVPCEQRVPPIPKRGRNQG